jgi:cell fate regulator YaaT (PSP1 superfamily)
MSLEPYIVGIQFQKIGKIYYFDASAYREINTGDYVVVDTSRGRQIGQVIKIVEGGNGASEGGWKHVQRPASAQDMIQRKYWQQKEIEAVVNCRAKASELRITNVKFVAAEYSYDGTRLSFLYSNEAGERMDFRNLRRSLQRVYSKSQIEFHLIGPRDIAKLLGGMGACGMDNRCCSKFLTEFSPISIKMAKEQGVSLTPSEITGMCGRLRCCLIYEYEQYVEARKHLPKRNKRVRTPDGDGKVVDILPLSDSVMVELDRGMVHQYTREVIQPLDELEALQRKSESGCDRHPDGNCECGKKGTSQKSDSRQPKQP